MWDEEFTGSIPKIKIIEDTDVSRGFFFYRCRNKGVEFRISRDDRGRIISVCGIVGKCNDCIAQNKNFLYFYTLYGICDDCKCYVDFGYFLIVYLLRRKNLLPENYKLKCCLCR